MDIPEEGELNMDQDRESSQDAFRKTGEIGSPKKRAPINQANSKIGNRAFLIDPNQKPKFAQPRIKVFGVKNDPFPNTPIVINEINEEEEEKRNVVRPGTGKSVATDAGRNQGNKLDDDDDLFAEFDRSIKQKYT
jgi:hypothetical protein